MRFGNTCLFTGLVCTRCLPGSPSKFIPYCCMWISAAFTPNPIVYDYIITPLEKFLGIGSTVFTNQLLCIFCRKGGKHYPHKCLNCSLPERIILKIPSPCPFINSLPPGSETVSTPMGMSGRVLPGKKTLTRRTSPIIDLSY